MKKKETILFLLIISMMFTTFVNATTYDFSSYEVRKDYNEKKFNTISSMLPAGRNRYKDIYLKDMYETDNKGMTVSQQKLIKELSETILNDENYTCFETDSEDICKLRKFHDWIKNNFYYYNPEKQENAQELGLSIAEYDNPYYVLTKNKITKTVTYDVYTDGDTEPERVTEEISHSIARCNGYTSVLIALARNAGMPAMAIRGHYESSFRQKANEDWLGIASTKIEEPNHAWVVVYVDNRWIIIDANADSYNSFSPTAKCVFRQDDEEMGGTPGSLDQESCLNSNRYAWGNWVTSSKKYFVKDYDNKYFDISTDDLADSHIIFEYRAGSKDVKYISNTAEATKLKTFLNRKTNGITNGKRINSSYNTSNPSTWFIKNDTKSLGDGYGRLYKLYWPENKKLWGRLNLNGFTSLQNVSVPKNRITSLYLENCPSLSTVAVANNKLTTISVLGTKKLTLLSAQGNPTTYVKYHFGTAPKTAIIKAGTGGTVSVKYTKTNGKYVHTMTAFPKSGYKFVGWYGSKGRFSTKASISVKNSVSFTYTAKFKKK